MASDIQETPFVKQLAANDRPTRDAALQSLKTYLSGRRSFSALEYMKLWKGLFYCMWMSDRPLTQQALASSLAALPSVMPADSQIPFLRAFWLTMAREWTNIDVLRMEKFLLLTRRYVGAMFAMMAEKGWEGERVAELLGLLSEVPLNAVDARLPNGMRYHVIDVYVDELQHAGALEAAGDLFKTLLHPLSVLEKDSPTRAVRSKCKEALKDERLPGNEGGNEGAVEHMDGEDEDEGWEGIKD